MYGATRLAGKFAKVLPKDDVPTMILGGVGAGALGAGGSLVGNLADDQIGVKQERYLLYETVL